jgi:hypothetical protein
VILLAIEGLVPEAPLPRLGFGFVGALPPGVSIVPGGGKKKSKKDASKKPKKKARAA